MSMYAFFGTVVDRIRRATWGTDITVDGQSHNTGVNPPMQEIADMLSDVGPIDLAGTLELQNNGNGAAISINSTNSDDGIAVSDQQGNTAQFNGVNGITTHIPFVGAFLDPAHPEKSPITVTVDACAVTVTYKRKTLEITNGFVTNLTGDPDT